MGTVTGPGTSLITAFDYVVGRFTDRLGGLSDAEYLWEPVAGCWSVRRGPDGRPVLDSRLDGPEPDPAPVTTIAWRTLHAASVFAVFAARLFGDDEGASELELPATATGVPAYLDAHYRAWRTPMAALDAAGWQRALGPGFEPFADDTVFDLALHVLDELVHHAAEVGVLRDLWANRATLTAATLAAPATPGTAA